MSEYLLEMSGICKSFAGVHALDHVNFKVRPGKVMCLAGENGCGKSTLVKIISGVYTRDEGTVTFEGKEIPHSMLLKFLASTLIFSANSC